MRQLIERCEVMVEAHPLEKYLTHPRGWGVKDGLRFKKDQEAWTAEQVKLMTKAQSIAQRALRDADPNDEEVFDSSGEVNMTGLSELVAHDLGHDEWLDDEGHWVWDVIADIATKWEKAHRR